MDFKKIFFRKNDETVAYGGNLPLNQNKVDDR